MYTWCGALAHHTDRYSKAKVESENACWERTDKIWEKRNQLTAQLRDYLEKLDVLENK